MIDLPASVRVYLCLNPCDMRRSFDGLHALVRDHLALDAFAGHLYVFTQQKKRSGEDFVLESRWICDMGETVRGRQLRDSVGGSRLAWFGNDSRGTRSTAERH